MKRLLQLYMWVAAVTLLSGLPLVQGHAAPGEDMIVLPGNVQFASAPTTAPSRSGHIEPSPNIPSWMQARISRYTAKAYSASADDGIIYTDNDVVTTTTVNGFRKTCVQEVGSNTASDGAFGTRYGPNQRDQVVVLRGDLVNICK